MRKYLLAFCFLLCIVRAGAQIDTEFWYTPYCELYGGSSANYSVKLLPVELNKTLKLTYHFPSINWIKPLTKSIDPLLPSSAVTENIDFSLAKSKFAPNTISNLSMYINLSGKSALFASPDSYPHNLKGRNALGNEFYIPMQNKYLTGFNQRDKRPKPSFLITATQDNTIVEITPSKDIVGHQAKNMFQILINKGQTYWGESKSYLASGRLEGTHIIANKPVVVDFLDPGPVVDEQFVGNLIGEQLVPVERLGTEYIAVKIPDDGNSELHRENELYVLAINDATKVYLDGSTSAFCTLAKGQQQSIPFKSETLYLRSSSPVYVFQLARSGNAFRGNLLPPIKRCNGINRYQVRHEYNSGSVGQLPNQICRFIVPVEIMDSFDMDGKPFKFKPQWIFPVKGLEQQYVVVKFPLDKIFNSLNPPLDSIPIINNKKGKFMASFLLNNETRFQTDFVNSGGDIVEKTMCEGDSLLFEYEPMQGKYLWNTGEASLGIKPSSSGKYWKKTTNGECTVTDTVYLKLNPLPKFTLGKDTSFCHGQALKLLAPLNCAHYKWQNGDSSAFFQAKETGTYTAEISDSFGCSWTDSIKIQVQPAPHVELKDQQFCDTTNCALVAKVDSMVSGQWNYKGAGGLVFSSTTSPTTHISVQQEGNYQIWYKATNRWACPFADTAAVSFYSHPLSPFSLDSTKCYGENLDVRYTGNLSPNADYHWDFGGCNVLVGQNQGPITIALGISANDKTIKLWVSEHGCASDTTIKRIKASPTFGFSTDSAKACAGIPVKFKAWSNKADLAYNWSFGDLGSSNEQNPVFAFTKAGEFPVRLTITGRNGCQNTDVMKDKIQVFDPIAQTNIEPDQCYGDTVYIRYAGKIGTDISLQWDFTDLNILSKEADGAYLIGVGGKASRKLGLTVMEHGCLSRPLSLYLKRKPHLSLHTDKTAGCSPLTVNFGIESSYVGETYQWELDGQKKNGDKQWHTLSEPGKYSLLLKARSDDGCELSHVYPSCFEAYGHPKASFDFSPHTALSGSALISFQNNSSGALRYAWDFGDGQTSIEENPKHNYEGSGAVIIKLQTENEFGCTDSISGQLSLINSTAVANAFSPHSLIEKNRVFHPIPEKVFLRDYDFKVFNRWGNVVFSTTNPEQGWDGSQNGVQLHAGAYVWIVGYRDMKGEEHKSAGTLLLVE